VRLTDAWLQLSDAPARLTDAWLKLSGAPARLTNAWLKLSGAPARLTGAFLRLTGVLLKLNDAGARLEAGFSDFVLVATTLSVAPPSAHGALLSCAPSSRKTANGSFSGANSPW
jgi:hypothetical protein